MYSMENNAHCFNSLLDAQLKGDPSSTNVQFIYLKVAVCDQSTAPEGVTCWTQPEREAFMNYKFWHVLGTQTYVLPESYDRILSHKVKSLFYISASEKNTHKTLVVKSGEIYTNDDAYFQDFILNNLELSYLLNC